MKIEHLGNGKEICSSTEYHFEMSQIKELKKYMDMHKMRIGGALANMILCEVIQEDLDEILTIWIPLAERIKNGEDLINGELPKFL